MGSLSDPSRDPYTIFVDRDGVRESPPYVPWIPIKNRGGGPSVLDELQSYGPVTAGNGNADDANAWKWNDGNPQTSEVVNTTAAAATQKPAASWSGLILVAAIIAALVFSKGETK
jgi:hypothetical protein